MWETSMQEKIYAILMPYATVKKIRGLVLRTCFMNVCLADGTTSKHLGMVRVMKINIDGFKFGIDVIVLKVNNAQDCPLILGRSLMVTSKSLLDMELKEVYIRSNGYYQCYKGTNI
ncbi:hypothetical protein MtrunA17_Chr7g0237191 [Medicago truncatula]|uniref:Uncharacterized protein n=1 Tax=Medicago truncatula TaxID=3880 RepID=A0A396GY01_MEDTR|nr:hypothetical protein MtrunA17_Chr7g0237191 [Medicago truncatula]